MAQVGEVPGETAEIMAAPGRATVYRQGFSPAPTLPGMSRQALRTEAVSLPRLHHRNAGVADSQVQRLWRGRRQYSGYVRRMS